MSDAIRYAVRVRGHLDARWAERYDAAEVVNHENGEATIYLTVTDQAALHGLLAAIRDRNLPLISLTESERPAL